MTTLNRHPTISIDLQSWWPKPGDLEGLDLERDLNDEDDWAKEPGMRSLKDEDDWAKAFVGVHREDPFQLVFGFVTAIGSAWNGEDWKAPAEEEAEGAQKVAYEAECEAESPESSEPASPALSSPLKRRRTVSFAELPVIHHVESFKGMPGLFHDRSLWAPEPVELDDLEIA